MLGSASRATRGVGQLGNVAARSRNAVRSRASPHGLGLDQPVERIKHEGRLAIHRRNRLAETAPARDGIAGAHLGLG